MNWKNKDKIIYFTFKTITKIQSDKIEITTKKTFILNKHFCTLYTSIIFLQKYYLYILGRFFKPRRGHVFIGRRHRRYRTIFFFNHNFYQPPFSTTQVNPLSTLP